MASTDKSPLELIDSCLTYLHSIKHAENHVTLSDTCPELSLQLDSPQLAQMDPPLDDETTQRQLHDVQHSLRSLQPHKAVVRAPVAPKMATVWPGSAIKLMPCKTDSLP